MGSAYLVFAKCILDHFRPSISAMGLVRVLTRPKQQSNQGLCEAHRRCWIGRALPQERFTSLIACADHLMAKLQDGKIVMTGSPAVEKYHLA